MSEIQSNQVTLITGSALNLPNATVSPADYDTVTIKNVSFSSEISVTMYPLVLWCTYTNSFISGFNVDNIDKYDGTHDITIKLNKPISEFSFKLYAYNSDDVLQPYPDKAIVSITLDFVKYK